MLSDHATVLLRLLPAVSEPGTRSFPPFSFIPKFLIANSNSGHFLLNSKPQFVVQSTICGTVDSSISLEDEKIQNERNSAALPSGRQFCGLGKTVRPFFFSHLLAGCVPTSPKPDDEARHCKRGSLPACWNCWVGGLKCRPAEEVV
jgi:hypothetical protein